MPVTRAADAHAYQLHGFTFRSLAATSLGSPDLAVWAADAPPRSAGPQHTMSRDEVIVVLAGRLTARIVDETFDLGPGDTLIVPAEQAFELANPNDEPASVIAITRTGMQATVGDNVISPPWAA